MCRTDAFQTAFFPLLLALILLLLPPSVAAAVADQPQVHVVQPGDTLSDLAERYGVTVDVLAAANGLADPNLIYVG